MIVSITFGIVTEHQDGGRIFRLIPEQILLDGERLEDPDLFGVLLGELDIPSREFEAFRDGGPDTEPVPRGIRLGPEVVPTRIVRKHVDPQDVEPGEFSVEFSAADHSLIIAQGSGFYGSAAVTVPHSPETILAKLRAAGLSTVDGGGGECSVSVDEFDTVVLWRPCHLSVRIPRPTVMFDSGNADDDLRSLQKVLGILAGAPGC